MDPAEIAMLSELSLIRNGVIAIAILLASMLLLRAFQAFVQLREINKIQKGESLRDMSVSYFEAGKYVELVAFLKPKIRKEPSNSTALYWMGRAYMELGNTAHAKVLLNKVKVLEPSWDEKYINPYLAQLEAPADTEASV